MNNFVLIFIFLIILYILTIKHNKQTINNPCDNISLIDVIHKNNIHSIDNYENNIQSMDKEELIEYIQKNIINPIIMDNNKKFKHIDLSRQSYYKLYEIVKNRNNLNELSILLDGCC